MVEVEQGEVGGPVLVIVGCGDLGLRLASGLPPLWRAVAVRRNTAALPPGVEGLAADYTRPGSLDALAALAPDFVVATFKPAGRDADGYRAGFSLAMTNLLRGLARHRPTLTVMVSSTRVYAETGGDWVSETSALAAEPRAGAIIDAERQLLGAGLPATVLRCGGIYGDPAGRLLDRVASGSLCPPAPVRYGNRIHREDVVGFAAHLLFRAQRGDRPAPVFNVVDDCPAPQHEVEQWLAARLGVAGRVDRAAADAHKRCANRALHTSGYRLRYPGFREGYSAVLAQRQAP